MRLDWHMDEGRGGEPTRMTACSTTRLAQQTARRHSSTMAFFGLSLGADRRVLFVPRCPLASLFSLSLSSLFSHPQSHSFHSSLCFILISHPNPTTPLLSPPHPLFSFSLSLLSPSLLSFHSILPYPRLFLSSLPPSLPPSLSTPPRSCPKSLSFVIQHHKGK
ncbi:hypothetical protein EDD21DRAFT_51894 [Dissophora ornata]|nr:hypothetical protein EDD21DRAFT_51894 [Dissophora ornata]